MPTLSLVVDAVLDRSLRLKVTGTGFNNTPSAKMLVVYDDVQVIGTGSPFASLVVDIPNIVDGAFERTFSILDLLNGELYVIKAMIGDIEASVVDGPSSLPATPVVSILEKKEDAIKIQVDLRDKLGGDLSSVLLFVKAVYGKQTSSLVTINLGSFLFEGKTRDQMIIERVFDSTVFAKEVQYEVSALSFSVRTGYGNVSQSIPVKMSNLLDSVRNPIVQQDSLFANTVNLTFDAPIDFSRYIEPVYGDNVYPNRITNITFKSPVSFDAGLKVGTSVLEPSVSVVPEIVPGKMVGGTLVDGVLTGQTWQDAFVSPFSAKFQIPDSLRKNPILLVVAKVISVCVQEDPDNLHVLNSVSSAVTSIVGQIGVAADNKPSVDVTLTKGSSDEDIIANIRVFFESALALSNYNDTNMAVGASDLTTFMTIKVGGVAIETDLQTGTIGVGLDNAFSKSVTLTASQYKDAAGLGKPLTVGFKSATTPTGIKTLLVDSGISKFVEQPGQLSGFSLEAAGTREAPLIRGTFALGPSYGSQPESIRVGHRQDTALVLKGLWSGQSAYAIGDAVTYNSLDYVAKSAVAAQTLAPAYQTNKAYQAGELASLYGINYERLSDDNTRFNLRPDLFTAAWTRVTIVPTDSTNWGPRFVVSYYPTQYSPTQADFYVNSKPDGTQFVLSSVVTLQAELISLDRNNTSNKLTSETLTDNKSYGSHVVKAIIETIVYDKVANTATVSMQDKIVDRVDIATFATNFPEYLSATTPGRLITEVAENAAFNLNVSILPASSDTGTTTSKTYNLLAGVAIVRFFRQKFSIASNGETFEYIGPVKQITFRVNNPPVLTNPTVAYSAAPVIPANYNQGTSYAAGARVLFGANAFTRTASNLGLSNLAPTVGGNINWTDNGVFSSARVTLADKAAATAALTNPLYSDIRTTFGCQITLNGATLSGWSTIGIPAVATPDTMAASYKTGTGLASFNSGDASLVEGQFLIKYAGVWSAAIEMVTSDEGGKLIAIPSNAAITSSL